MWGTGQRLRLQNTPLTPAMHACFPRTCRNERYAKAEGFAGLWKCQIGADWGDKSAKSLPSVYVPDRGDTTMVLYGLQVWKDSGAE